MDARINPAAALGLAEGDAHVIRNAGGRVSDDALRSLVISHKLLGTNEWFVVHHSDCGMEYFTGAQLAALLDTSLATAAIVPAPGAKKGVAFANTSAEGGSAAGHAIDWLHIDDQEASIKADVEKVVSSPLTAPGIPVHGYLCVAPTRTTAAPPPGPTHTETHRPSHFPTRPQVRCQDGQDQPRGFGRHQVSKVVAACAELILLRRAPPSLAC